MQLNIKLEVAFIFGYKFNTKNTLIIWFNFSERQTVCKSSKIISRSHVTSMGKQKQLNEPNQMWMYVFQLCVVHQSQAVNMLSH